jgi:D-sedoheptulose 7-phosphate isomerase
MSEGTDFLYPFIEGDERDADSLLRDLAASAEGKDAISRALQRATLDREEASIVDAATAMAQRFAAGGRLFTFGNGGSSTDAASLASHGLSDATPVALPRSSARSASCHHDRMTRAARAGAMHMGCRGPTLRRGSPGR